MPATALSFSLMGSTRRQTRERVHGNPYQRPTSMFSSSVTDNASPARRSGWSLRAKLLALVALTLILISALQAWDLARQRGTLLQAKRTEVQSLTQSVFSIVQHFHAEAQAGRMTEAEAKALAAAAARAIRFGDDNNYVFIIDANAPGYPAHGGNPKLESTPIDTIKIGSLSFVQFVANLAQNVRRTDGIFYQPVSFPRPGGTAPVPKLNGYLEFKPWAWFISTGVYLDDVDAVVRDTLIAAVGTTLGAVLLLLCVGLLITRSVIRQVGAEPREVIAVMGRAAQGDLSQRFPQAPAGSILASFGDMSNAVREVIAQVRNEASAMKNDAQRIAETVRQVSEAAIAQSSATASVAAAVEELTVSVTHISDAANDTERNSEGVAQKCRDGQDDVQRSTEGMQRIGGAIHAASEQIGGLADRAQQISAIAASIKDIAAQTNLLALNAAIEAARAGEQGRGFSVVADEVRKLAERTGLATVEIDETVGAVQRESLESSNTMTGILPLVADGNAATEQMARALGAIGESAETSLQRVREVAHATREQSSASTAIAQQVESIAQMVEQTTAAMGETSRSAQELSEMADRLDGLVASFKV